MYNGNFCKELWEGYSGKIKLPQIEHDLAFTSPDDSLRSYCHVSHHVYGKRDKKERKELAFNHDIILSVYIVQMLDLQV